VTASAKESDVVPLSVYPVRVEAGRVLVEIAET
jgi:hypothetical protein